MTLTLRVGFLPLADAALLIVAKQKGFAEARQYIERQPGLIRIEMRQGIESPDCFMLLAWWDSVESHMEGFRKSADFAKWRAPLAPCFSDKPVWMEHFAVEL